jgi:hypothetical protein
MNRGKYIAQTAVMSDEIDQISMDQPEIVSISLPVKATTALFLLYLSITGMPHEKPTNLLAALEPSAFISVPNLPAGANVLPANRGRCQPSTFRTDSSAWRRISFSMSITVNA